MDWNSRPHTPQKVANKTSAKVEREICALRKKPETQGALGFTGALTLRDALQGSDVPDPVPSVRTIGRILHRHGLLDRRRRFRRAAPPAGWYLPGLVQGLVDVDCFDVIEDLRLENFGLIQIFTAKALWVPHRRGLASTGRLNDLYYRGPPSPLAAIRFASIRAIRQ